MKQQRMDAACRASSLERFVGRILRREIMREDDNAALYTATDETLAQWWCDLNNWGWPADLADEELKEYKPGGRRSLIMNAIVSKIGMKECLRCWNKDRMPGEEFDRWYDGGRRHAPNA